MHWVRDTDNARESLTLLTDALEILVKESIEGVTTVNFSSSVSDITVMTAVSKTIFQKKISIALLIFINFNLSFIWWIFLYNGFVYNSSSW